MNWEIKISKQFESLIKRSAHHDPLVLQILPQIEEQKIVKGFMEDPLGEKKAEKIPGLLHKYHGRVLLLVSNVCSIHCRFCFRKGGGKVITDWDQVLRYLKNNHSLKEVILSGGDPLMLSVLELKNIIHKIATIPHIKTLRLHSRVPIALPSHINSALLKILTSTRLNIVMVVHSNHPQELDQKVAQAVKKMRDHHIFLLNQSVLLKGINDDAKILILLSERLFTLGILPYYLHRLDKVEGTSHFFVAEQKALKIYKEMVEKLPGYLVPKFVFEEAGAKAKVSFSKAQT